MCNLKEYGILYHILQIFGLLENADETIWRKVTRIASNALLIAIYVDYIIVCASTFELYLVSIRTFLPCTLSYTISILIFYCMSHRKKRITQLLRLLVLHDKFRNSMKLNVYVVAIILSNISILIFHIIFDRKNPFFVKVYSYGTAFEANSSLKYYTSSFRYGMHLLLHPLFVNIISLLYCELCHRVFLAIASNTAALEVLKTTTYNKHNFIRILHNRSEIVELAKSLQNEFSLIISLAFLSLFFNLFAILSFLIAVRYVSFLQIYWSFVMQFINNITNLMVVIFCAGQVPEEMENLCEVLNKVSDYWIHRDVETGFSQGVINSVHYKPDIVLSASELFYFRKSSMLSVIGCLLTYSLLLTSIVD